MRVAAVIPNWNGAELLRRLFPTILAQTRPFDSILVVDNGSTDDSISVCNQFGADTLQFSTNRGFAPAVNAGVNAVQADAVAVLNNDVEVAPAWLETLVGHMKDETVSFATGKILSASDHRILDGTFDAICRGGAALRCGAGRPDGPYWGTSMTIRFAPFTAVLVRKSAFLRVGGLEDALESYLEDVDFGLRCASFGYTGVYEPAAVATHRGSATLGEWHPRTVRNIARNQLLLVARHYDTTCLLRFGWSIAVAQLLWGVIALRRGAALAWIAGKLEGVRLFRSYRGSGHPHMQEVVKSSERLLLDVQSQTGFDLYWRIYFALTIGRWKN